MLIRHIFTISSLSYLIYSVSKYFHRFRDQKFYIISCLNFKCNSLLSFIYQRIVSQCFMFFDDILKIILNIWYEYDPLSNVNFSLHYGADTEFINIASILYYTFIELFTLYAFLVNLLMLNTMNMWFHLVIFQM